MDREYKAMEHIPENGRQPTRVLIVDDQPLFREMLFVYLTMQKGIQVIGAVDTGHEAIRVANDARPDVVVMDHDLGVQPDGLRAAHLIKASSPSVGIVILSERAASEYAAVVQTRKSAGWSFLLKQSIRDGSTLLRAIEGAAWGQVTVDPALLKGVSFQRRSVLERLTGEQLKVLKDMAAGFNDQAIARRTGISGPETSALVESVYQDLHIGHDLGVDQRVRAVLTYLRETAGSAAQPG
jgi:DNA-binding NarL/FixJ family response regulator